MSHSTHLRNIAIIAHVDHGKTTLIDQLLKQSSTLKERQKLAERAMDSNALEQERGITILAKNTAISWKDYHINIIDTPGHADFGGEVERVLSMVDAVLLLVDAVDGPMPQTRFVTQKAFAHGLNPIVVINKIDRDGARPEWVMDQVFDLFDSLGATDEQLDFKVVYASAIQGFASLDEQATDGDMEPLFETIVSTVSPPDVQLDAPLQLQVSQLDYSPYLGVMGIGRIKRGRMQSNMQVSVIDGTGKKTSGRILKIFGFHGLERIERQQAEAGEIIVFSGLEKVQISATVCDPDCIEALPELQVDEPTVSMNFLVNTSPFCGKEVKGGTSSRRLRERLEQELLHNVALRVEDTDDTEKFKVSGRGELHLGILIENMRREGYEMAVSRPEVVIRQSEDGSYEEPYENVLVDVEQAHQGALMELLGERRAELKNMQTDDRGRVQMQYLAPARGLIGLQTLFLTITSGTGLLYRSFSHYGAYNPEEIGQRNNGAMISNANGKALAYALFNLQERGQLFIGHAEEVYEGMVIGIHSRDSDLVVNPLKAKQLTNIRAAGTDENLILTPPIRMTLEQALEFIDDDELVEVTPQSIRIRKKHLLESDRKRASRSS